MTETLPFEEKAVEESLGAFLSSVRQEKGISLEQAAHDTRIRPQRLREMESDDFSHFSHPSYSRMFLMDYAKYLGVPVAKIRDFLPEGGACGSAGYDYLQNMPEHTPKMARVERPRLRRGPMPILASAAVVILCGVAAMQAWILSRNIGRLDLDNKTTQAAPAAPVAPAFEPQVEAAAALAPVAETAAAEVAPQPVEVIETEEDMIAAAEAAGEPDAFRPPPITLSPDAVKTAATAPVTPAQAPATLSTLDDHALLFVDGAHGQNTSIR